MIGIKDKLNRQLWNDIVAISKFLFDVFGAIATGGACLYGMGFINWETCNKLRALDPTHPGPPEKSSNGGAPKN